MFQDDQFPVTQTPHIRIFHQGLLVETIHVISIIFMKSIVYNLQENGGKLISERFVKQKDLNVRPKSVEMLAR